MISQGSAVTASNDLHSTAANWGMASCLLLQVKKACWAMLKNAHSLNCSINWRHSSCVLSCQQPSLHHPFLLERKKENTASHKCLWGPHTTRKHKILSKMFHKCTNHCQRNRVVRKRCRCWAMLVLETCLWPDISENIHLLIGAHEHFRE